MVSSHTELSAVATTLDDLVTRITALAERHLAARDEQGAAELFEVERSLRAAARRLTMIERRSH